MCALNIFIDLYTCYIHDLWNDEDLVPDEAMVDRGSIVYPLVYLRFFFNMSLEYTQ